MSDIINTLLSKRDEELTAARVAQEAEEKEIVEKRLKEIREFLGEFWTLLEERYNQTGETYFYKIQWNNGRTEADIFYNIPVLPEYELAPIVITWDRYSLSPNYHSYNNRFRVAGESYRDLDDALAAARAHYPEYVKAEREKKIKEHEGKFSFYYHNETKTEEDVRANYASYITEFPDRQEQAEALLRRWIDLKKDFDIDRENSRREREQREAENQLREMIRIAYVAELAEWIKNREAIEEKNKKTAEAIQTRADLSTYRVYKLTYALVAEYNEDGELEHVLETRSVYTSNDRAGSDGYYIVDGKPIGYFHPVSIEPLDVRASSGILAKTFKKGGVEVFFPPWISDDLIERDLAEIKELPEFKDAPEKPEELQRHYEMYDLQRWARELLRDGKTDLDLDNEVPF